MKKIASFISLSLLTAVLCWASSAGFKQPTEMRVMMKINGFKDGSQAVRYFVLDEKTGRPRPITTAESAYILSESLALQAAILTRSWHWEWPKLIKFNNTKDSKPHKKKVKGIMNKYNNKNRGNSNVPKMKITTKIDQVIPITGFQNPFDFYTQLDFDKKNTVVMTPDDQFFKDLQGNLFDPEIVSSTSVFASITSTMQGNRWVGTFWIIEADVYFRSDFFGLVKNVYNLLGTAAIRGALGFQPTTWSHDYMSSNNPHVSASAFNNPASDVWTKVSHPRDNLYYLDKLGGAFKADFLSTPQILPFEDEVIDIGGYDLPEVENNDIDLGKTPILFLTNLKAFSGKKKMIVKIWRLTDDSPPKQVKLVTLKGNTLDYPVIFSGNTEVYASIFLNHVRLGREKELDKLEKAVKDHGVKRFLEGIEFEKAIKILVKVTGFLEENGKKVSISRSFWLVDTEE